MKTKGMIALTATAMFMFFMGLSVVLRGSSLGMKGLFWLMSVVLPAYFGKKAVEFPETKGIEKVSSFLEQEIWGVSVKAILALVIGIGGFGILGFLTLIGYQEVITALIGYENVIVSYYFSSEATKSTRSQ